uniref:Uncharacterized protein n=1 Tax=Knipowitschia caucasica TaxID=637954 RepID=A0AAV2JIB1_KNICA
MPPPPPIFLRPPHTYPKLLNFSSITLPCLSAFISRHVPPPNRQRLLVHHCPLPGDSPFPTHPLTSPLTPPHLPASRITIPPQATHPPILSPAGTHVDHLHFLQAHSPLLRTSLSAPAPHTLLGLSPRLPYLTLNFNLTAPELTSLITESLPP